MANGDLSGFLERLEALPTFVVRHGAQTAQEVKALFDMAQGNAVHTNGVFYKVLTSASVVVEQAPAQIVALVPVLAAVAKDSPERLPLFLKFGETMAPFVAEKDPRNGVAFVKALATSLGVDTSQDVVCDRFMYTVSKAPDGQGREMVAFFGRTPRETWVFADNYTNTLEGGLNELPANYVDGLSRVFGHLSHVHTLPTLSNLAKTAKAPAVA